MSEPATVTVRFVSAEGVRVQEVAAHDGDCLLAVAQAAGQPLEGTCEGQMACSTCHVIIDPADADKLPPATEMEEDMLDLATGATRTSRLSCQVTLRAAMESLSVRIPSMSRNMQGS